jgi:hypothetical protein
MRWAQVSTLGGSARLCKAACESTLGSTLGAEGEEEFAQSMLQWMCQREDELQLVDGASVMNHLMVQYETRAVRLTPYSEEVANRNIGHGATENGSLNERRACTCEHGLQSRRGKSAGVAKRPRERSPTRIPTLRFAISSPRVIPKTFALSPAHPPTGQ